MALWQNSPYQNKRREQHETLLDFKKQNKHDQLILSQCSETTIFAILYKVSNDLKETLDVKLCIST